MSFQPHGLSINMLPEPLHFQKGNVLPSQWHFYQNAAALSVHEKILFRHCNLSTTSLYRMPEGLNVKECACNSRRPPNVVMFRPSPRAACTMGACPATPAGPSSEGTPRSRRGWSARRPDSAQSRTRIGRSVRTVDIRNA